MRQVDQAVSMGQMKNAYKVLVGKPEIKRPLVRPWCRWKCNIRMDFRETEGKGVDGMQLALDSDKLLSVVNVEKSSCSIRGGKFLD
jgi:hypothetical protein